MVGDGRVWQTFGRFRSIDRGVCHAARWAVVSDDQWAGLGGFESCGWLWRDLAEHELTIGAGRPDWSIRHI